MKYLRDINNDYAVFITNRFLIWVLGKVFFLIYKLPYWTGGMYIMWWILSHTPADERETK